MLLEVYSPFDTEHSVDEPMNRGGKRRLYAAEAPSWGDVVPCNIFVQPALLAPQGASISLAL